MELLVLSVFLGFLVTFLGGPHAKKYLLSSGIYGIDQQKPDKPKIPTSGGLLVLFGFIISVTSFLAFSQFYYTSGLDITETLAALSSVTIIALIGLIDDIHINIQQLVNEEVEQDIEIDLESPEEPETSLIWEKIAGSKGNTDTEAVHRLGLGQLPKMLFVLPAVLPLIAVGAGSWTMNLPLLGTVNWGLVYPLILLPLGLLFVSNVVNMLAGTNGLSAGMSLVASTGLGLFALMNNEIEAAVIAFSLSGALLGFLKYNMYPSSLLPGDSLTYLCGAALFSSMVVGDMEKFGVFIFAPWFLEFGLKLRSGFRAHSWGILQSDGSLKPQHEKNYSLTHPLMRRGFSEKKITLILVGVEVLVVSAGLALFSLSFL